MQKSSEDPSIVSSSTAVEGISGSLNPNAGEAGLQVGLNDSERRRRMARRSSPVAIQPRDDSSHDEEHRIVPRRQALSHSGGDSTSQGSSSPEKATPPSSSESTRRTRKLVDYTKTRGNTYHHHMASPKAYTTLLNDVKPCPEKHGINLTLEQEQQQQPLSSSSSPGQHLRTAASRRRRDLLRGRDSKELSSSLHSLFSTASSSSDEKVEFYLKIPSKTELKASRSLTLLGQFESQSNRDGSDDPKNSLWATVHTEPLRDASSGSSFRSRRKLSLDGALSMNNTRFSATSRRLGRMAPTDGQGGSMILPSSAPDEMSERELEMERERLQQLFMSRVNSQLHLQQQTIGVTSADLSDDEVGSIGGGGGSAGSINSGRSLLRRRKSSRRGFIEREIRSIASSEDLLGHGSTANNNNNNNNEDDHTSFGSLSSKSAGGGDVTSPVILSSNSPSPASYERKVRMSRSKKKKRPPTLPTRQRRSQSLTDLDEITLLLKDAPELPEAANIAHDEAEGPNIPAGLDPASSAGSIELNSTSSLRTGGGKSTRALGVHDEGLDVDQAPSPPRRD